jgi:myo-inositol 2-dehydrogenase / D-chiro-inositol 1-dehydrogenase
VTGVVLVGAGGVARRHATVLAGLQVAVLAVVDTDLEAANALAIEHGAAAFTDPERALDEVEPDAVYSCTPPFARGAAERAALHRGLPLFAEKPLAADLAVAEEIAELAQQAGVVTGTGYHWRCLDTVAHAAQLLRAAPPRLATGYWLDKRPPVAWWGRRDGSGGQVVEQLTHVLDLARVLLGEAQEVYAVAAGAVPVDPAAVDDATAATVRFRSGAVATFAATCVLDAKAAAGLDVLSPGLRLRLTETSLSIDDGSGERRIEPVDDPRVLVDRAFIAAVRGEPTGILVPYPEALRTHRLACAIARSARSGVPERLEP